MRAREVPFAAEAVDGWRAWSVIERNGDVWLSSLTRAQEWEPASALVASCSRPRHDPPRRRCSCGIYAAAGPEELAGLGPIAGAAVGQVSLWGRIAEHSRGYRAERAYPARLRLVCVPCLGDGDGVPATKVDRDLRSDRVRLVPLCDAHAAGRSLRPAAEVERRLLDRYRVEQVPDASVARIRRDPTSGEAERRSRRRVAAAAAAAVAVAVLITVAFAGGVAREGPARTMLALPSALPNDVVRQPPHNQKGDGDAVSAAVDVVRYCQEPECPARAGGSARTRSSRRNSATASHAGTP